MYEKTYGEKYDANLTTAEIAKRIRADIKAAVKSGALPAGLEVSVRKARTASIRVEVTACPFRIASDALVAHRVKHGEREMFMGFVYERTSPEATATLATLREIANAYNYDGSEIESDYVNVNYYLNVGLVVAPFELVVAPFELARPSL